jgi:hypothetical protein
MQNTEYIIKNRETHVHKITNAHVFMALGLNDFNVGKSITQALVVDVARIKIITSRDI